MAIFPREFALHKGSCYHSTQVFTSVYVPLFMTFNPQLFMLSDYFGGCRLADDGRLFPFYALLMCGVDSRRSSGELLYI